MPNSYMHYSPATSQMYIKMCTRLMFDRNVATVTWLKLPMKSTGKQGAAWVSKKVFLNIIGCPIYITAISP